MTEFWSEILAAVGGAVVAAVAIAILNRLSPFTAVVSSTALGFALVGLGWLLDVNELLVAAVAVVATGLLGALYIALRPRSGSGDESPDPTPVPPRSEASTRRAESADPAGH